MGLDTNGRDRDRVVRRYLSSLDAHRPGRSAAKTAESLHHRMHQIDTDLMSADPVQRLHLTQERIDLHAEQLRLASGNGDHAEIEKAFVRVARGYGERHGITYSAWRQVGVDADVLAAAGIKPTKAPRTEPAAGGGAAQAPQAAPASESPEPKAAPEPAPAPAPPEVVEAKKAPAAAKKSSPKSNGVKTPVKKAAQTGGKKNA